MMSVFVIPILQLEGFSTIFLWAALILSTLLFSAFILTFGRSVQLAWRRKRRKKMEAQVKSQILSGLASGGSEWNSLTSTKSRVKRVVIRSQVEHLLRNFAGEYRIRLQNLCKEAGFIPDAANTLQSADEFEKLDILNLYTLLGQPIDPDLLKQNCVGSSRLRSASARLLFESDHPEACKAGFEILFYRTDDSLSTFGLDTAFRLFESDPAWLLDKVDQDLIDWNNSLVIQILLIFTETSHRLSSDDLSWIYHLLDHENPRIRSVAVSALRPYMGETLDIKSVPVKDLLQDSSPRVRASTYRLLATLEDPTYQRLLVSAAKTEPDEQALFVLADSYDQVKVSLELPERPTFLAALKRIREERRLRSDPSEFMYELNGVPT